GRHARCSCSGGRVAEKQHHCGCAGRRIVDGNVCEAERNRKGIGPAQRDSGCIPKFRSHTTTAWAVASTSGESCRVTKGVWTGESARPEFCRRRFVVGGIRPPRRPQR